MRRLLLVGAVPLMLIIFGCGPMTESDITDLPRLLDTGRWQEAEQVVANIIAADPHDSAAIYGRGVLEEYQGREWDALISYLDASRAGGGYGPAMKSFTRLAITLDYLPNGRKMANLLVGQYPDDADGYFFLADLDMREDKLDSARDRITRAAERTDDTLRVVLYESELDLRSYDSTAIETTLARLAETEFNSAEHFHRLAYLFAYLNLGDSVIHCLDRAVDKDRDNYRLKIDLARALFDNRRLYEALELTDEILEKSRKYGNALIVAAHIEKALNRTMKAERIFMDYFRLDRTSPIPLEKRGDFLNYFDDSRRSMNEYQSALLLAENLNYADDYILQLFYKLAYSFLDNLDPVSAREKLDIYESLAPDSYEMYFLKANIMLAYPEMQDSARTMIDRLLPQHEDDRPWLELAAHHYYRTKKLDKAADLYQRLLTFPYPRYEYFVDMLNICRDRKYSARADSLAASMPFRFRNSRPFMEILRDLHRESGDLDKAVAYAENLYRQSAGYLPDLTILSELYIRQGRIDEAGALFGQFTSEYPGVAPGHCLLAEFELEHGDRQNVLSLLDKSIALDSAFGDAYELKGLYFQNEDRIDSALYYFRHVVKMDWRTPSAYYYLGQYYLQQGDSLDRAAGLGMAAVRLFEGKDRRGYLLLGGVYMKQERYKLARQQFSKGIRHFPEDAEMQFLLGKSSFRLEDKDRSRRALKKALEIGLASPQKEDAQDMLSRL